jgi:hypothetical protein
VAELNAPATTTAEPCCDAEQQASCCRPSAEQVTSRIAAGGVALPMTASCALDEPGLRSQLERYRQMGRAARLHERTPRRLVAQIDESVDATLVTEAVAVERSCCPFFLIDWEPSRRSLTISVSQAAHEAALDAVAIALGLQRSD